MFETVKEFDEETDTKEKNSLFTWEPNNLPLSVIVYYSYEINNSLMIKGDETKNNKSIGQFKDDFLFLLNYAESTFHDKPIKNIWRNITMIKHSVNVRNVVV